MQLAKYGQYKSISIGKIGGSLSKKIIIYDLKIDDLRNLAAGSTLQIQSLRVKIGLFSKKLDTELKKGVFKAPHSDAVYFAGTCNDGILSMDVNGNLFDLREISGLLPEELAADNVSGVLRNIRFSITGRIDALNIKGKLGLENMRYNNLVIEKCSSIILDLTLKASEKNRA